MHFSGGAPVLGGLGKATVEDRIAQFGEAARLRLKPSFDAAGVAYPPRHLVLVVLKDERRLEACAGESPAELRFIRSWPIVAASGRLGPKLREGDRQVPEGLYRIESLNPNSRYHLALRVNYPNDFDRARGAEDGRADLGGDIMIHGSSASIGCLAMGDEASEDLFVLAAETGLENIRVILSPVDFRARELPSDAGPLPPWTDGLYAQIRRELAKLPRR
jgi:hypothetical protein